MRALNIDASGVLTVDGVAVSGVVTKYDIRGGVMMDRAAREGSSGKSAVFSGYDDMTLTLELRMYSSSRYEAVHVLNAAFTKLDGEVPAVYALDFPLAKAMNYKTALIKTLRVSQGKSSEDVVASIELEETNPVVSGVQKQRANSPKTQPAAQKETNETARAAESLLVSKNDRQRMQYIRSRL